MLLWNYPGQAFSEWREQQLLNNEYLATILQYLLLHLGKKSNGGTGENDEWRESYGCAWNRVVVARRYGRRYDVKTGMGRTTRITLPILLALPTPLSKHLSVMGAIYLISVFCTLSLPQDTPPTHRFFRPAQYTLSCPRTPARAVTARKLLEHTSMSRTPPLVLCFAFSGDFDSDRPYHLVGFGSGGAVATFYASHFATPSPRSLLLLNSFSYVDAYLAGVLHDCLNVFNCAPESRPDLPVYFHARFLFSPAYLGQVPETPARPAKAFPLVLGSEQRPCGGLGRFACMRMMTLIERCTCVVLLQVLRSRHRHKEKAQKLVSSWWVWPLCAELIFLQLAQTRSNAITPR